MKLITYKRNRIYFLGIPLLSCCVQNGIERYCLLGLTLIKRETIYAKLCHMAERKTFDARPTDAAITLAVEDALPDNIYIPDQPPSNTVAVLTSKLRDKSGGDMRWMSDIMSLLSSEYDIALFLTDYAKSELAGKDYLNYFSERYQVHGISRFPRLFQTRVIQLYEKIARLNPKSLFVMMHPADIWGAAVLVLIKKFTRTQILFCLHAPGPQLVGSSFGDCFLTGLPSMVAEKYTRQHLSNLKLSRSSLTSGAREIPARPLSTQERNRIRKTIGISVTCQMTLSGGEASKFFNADGSSDYFNGIRDFLDAHPHVEHVILSDFSKSQLNTIHHVFRHHKDARNRLRLLQRTPNYEQIFMAADVFIDSFPCSGAYTMIDLMRLGVPYVVKINKENPRKSFQEYQADNYPFMFSDVDEFFKGVDTLLSSAKTRDYVTQINRSHYIQFYSAAPCRKYLKDLIEPPPSKNIELPLQVKLTPFTDLPYEKQMETLSWRNAPEVSRFFRYATIEKPQHEHWLQEIAKPIPKIVAFLISVHGHDVGVCYLSEIDRTQQSCAWGCYLLNSTFTGRGIGAEVMKQSLEFAKVNLGIRHVVLEVWPWNMRARRLYEHFRFVPNRAKCNDLLCYELTLPS